MHAYRSTVAYARRVSLCIALSLAPVDALADAAREVFVSLNEAGRLELQTVLLRSGLYRSTIDGLYGSETSKALHEAAVMLEDVGIHYDLDDPKSVTDFFSFITTEAGATFLLPEGNECDGCVNGAIPVDEFAFVNSDNTVSARVSFSGRTFMPIRSASVPDVRLENGYCMASLGDFTDGTNTISVSAFRSYNGWGFQILSQQNINPPIIPPLAHVFSGRTLPMSGQSRRLNDGWRATYTNMHESYMDHLGDQTSVSLPVGQDGGIFRIYIPTLPSAVAAFRNCLYG